MLKPVVSNSSPIIHLAKIDQLHLLEGLFGEIIIPEAVYKECIIEGKGRSEVSRILKASWLRMVPVQNQILVKLLNSEIDQGESEAITLALETNASLILLDDADAREKARLYKLQITGIIGVLLRSKKSGNIESLAPILDRLRNTGFWLSDKIITRLLIEAGEGVSA